MFGERDSYGMGWFVGDYNGHRIINHGGGITGFGSQFLHFPDDQLTIVVLSNIKFRDDGRAPVDTIARAIAARALAPSASTCPHPSV